MHSTSRITQFIVFQLTKSALIIKIQKQMFFYYQMLHYKTQRKTFIKVIYQVIKQMTIQVWIGT